MDKQVRPGSTWFVVSLKWIESYQRYLYLDYIQGQPLDIPDSERVKPAAISNQDILLVPPKGTFLMEQQTQKLWQNILMKPNLKEGEHFMLVDEFTWDFVKARYQVQKDHEIKRMGISVNEDTEEGVVELYLRSIIIFPVPNTIQLLIETQGLGTVYMLPMETCTVVAQDYNISLTVENIYFLGQ